MKLKLSNEYKDVNFWSFMKCTFLVQLALMGLCYAAMFIFIALLIALMLL